MRRHLIAAPVGTFVLELPAYHMPTLRGLLLQTWQRLQGFVVRAGKAIVLVVVILNTVNSIGTDGSIGNENSENSVLSAIAGPSRRCSTPWASTRHWPPRWQSFTVSSPRKWWWARSIALYAPQTEADDADLLAMLGAAAASVPDNLAELGGAVADPLGLNLDALGDAEATAADQDVELDTIAVMRTLFHGELGAFSYLLFILLYMLRRDHRVLTRNRRLLGSLLHRLSVVEGLQRRRDRLRSVRGRRLPLRRLGMALALAATGFTLLTSGTSIGSGVSFVCRLTDRN